MRILKADWLITSNDNGTIIKNGAVVYDSMIIDVGDEATIIQNHPNLTVEELPKNSVLMPGLINSHVHLEFSSNTTTLKYGNFMQWLHSVISKREELVESATQSLITEKLDEMLNSGTTTIGAISSYAFDLKPCVQSPMNTVFFTEVIGSKMDMVDTLFADFKARLNQAKSYMSQNFIPAVAIHSPYAVHPFLIREALKVAAEDKLAVSTHFLESPEEKVWLHKDEGSFLEFFKNFLGQDRSVTKPLEFLNQFKHLDALSFTHCVEANEQDLEQIKELGGVINHCVTSNRLLNNSKLDIAKLNVPFAIGTDGLSSNNSLSMFDELRNALMTHVHVDLHLLSKLLLEAATKNGGKALGLNKGVLQKDYDADMIVLSLPDHVEEEEDLCTQVILHTQTVDQIIIGGSNV